jgi:Spy/CpxP family protein refolding chaperone
MKLKLIPGLVKTLASFGAIAAMSTAAIVMTPVVVKAQSPTASFSALTQLFPILSGVELTAQQKIQIAELATDTQSQLEQIVTPDQRDKFRATLSSGKGFDEAFAAMNITPDQQSKVQSLMLSTRTKLVSTFTQEQRQKILENVRSLLMVGSGQ